jgi:hypothetical protein
LSAFSSKIRMRNLREAGIKKTIHRCSFLGFQCLDKNSIQIQESDELAFPSSEADELQFACRRSVDRYSVVPASRILAIFFRAFGGVLTRHSGGIKFINCLMRTKE